MELLPFVRSLIEQRCPTLDVRSLAHGGLIYARSNPKQPEPGVHILFSSLPAPALAETLADVVHTHHALGEIFDAAYAEVLREFNGASFFHPYAYLYGRQAPREVNRADVGYAPSQLHSANHHERKFGIPLSELMIGGTWGPDTVVTVDVARCVRMRLKKDPAQILDQFAGYIEFFDFLLDTRYGPGKSWAASG